MRPTRSRSVLASLFALATRLPWWGALLCALAAYVLLQPVAMLQIPAPSGSIDVAVTAFARLFVALARSGQYLLPVLFLASATISGFDRWKRSDLRESVARDTSGSILRGLRWPDFELLVSEVFLRQGFDVAAPGTGSGESAKRLSLSRNDRHYLVDCTDWRSWKSGADAVRQLHERMTITGAQGGFAVTSGQFTPQAKRFAVDKNIELIDGRHLKDLIRTNPHPAQDQQPSAPGNQLSKLATGASRVLRGYRRQMPQADDREPKVGLDPAPMPNASARVVPTTPDPSFSAADDAEAVAGAQLGALIREERDLDAAIPLRAPPVQASKRRAPHKRMPRPKIRPRKIVDIIGILLAIGLLWTTWERFVQLPDAPSAWPWSLLGAGIDSELLARRLRGIERSASGKGLRKGERPLGQFQFGPPGRIADLKPLVPGPGSYGSLHELETAFEAKYVPPPECYSWESNEQMVKCGNHRIRARREFIASGGEETPILFGMWEAPGKSWRPYDQWARQQGASEEWRPYPSREEQGQQGDGQGPGQPRIREYPLAPEQDWRTENAVRSGWQRPRDVAATGPRTQWQSDEDYEPQANRQHKSSADWRQEFARDWEQESIEQPPLAPQDDWRRQWVRTPASAPDTGWRAQRQLQPGQSFEGDSENSWRQGWVRDAQTQGEGDWLRDQKPPPRPVESRHWVDVR